MVSINNAQLLMPDGNLELGSLVIDEGRISEISSNGNASQTAGSNRIDADGLWVVPGIVDIHGDAFERQLMPRTGVHFPCDMAFLETDRQMVSNGITTAFHGVTFSWEPGLRGRKNFLRIKEALAALKDKLACDTKLHVRFETYNLDVVDEIETWMKNGEVGILAYNDHTPKIHSQQANAQKVAEYAGRAGIDDKAYVALVNAVIERREEVPAAIGRLARIAEENGVAQLSHDDNSSEVRQYYNDLGCRVSEFPVTADAITKATELGNPVVMGGPNVVRGGSHNGGISARDMILSGQCHILASDYYYPSIVSAVFKLIHNKDIAVGKAWELVSAAPAQASGLNDRGSLEPGKRADLLIVDPATALPRVTRTFVGGRSVYQA
ncbi:MAG: alpha-D-ribose 1-methylphosphonate 5-triphosphate diphosphatase [Rhodospirillales bacterium]|nr:alpha-D-ribose 1-methylphosphonate 5-triphosphate diphosphatase [Rhodospirillales bacterium]